MNGTIKQDISSRMGKVLSAGTPVKIFKPDLVKGSTYCDIEVEESFAPTKSILERTWSGVPLKMIEIKD